MKVNTMKAGALALVAVLGLSSVASAALITYVDAAASNTTLADGSAWTTSTADADDGLWRARTGIANGSTVFEARAGEDVTNMKLRTTISGLTDGQQYNLYAYYWIADYPAPQGNAEWDISAGLASDAMTEYAWDGGPAADAADFDAAVLVTESNRQMRQIDLGSFTADISGAAEIYINGTVGGDDRSWYDGVGYEAVPEPATLGLVALFGGGILFIRRRLSI